MLLGVVRAKQEEGLCRCASSSGNSEPSPLRGVLRSVLTPRLELLSDHSLEGMFEFGKEACRSAWWVQLSWPGKGIPKIALTSSLLTPCEHWKWQMVHLIPASAPSVHGDWCGELRAVQGDVGCCSRHGFDPTLLRGGDFWTGISWHSGKITGRKGRRMEMEKVQHFWGDAWIL